jgi:esterase/lipase superfamily enzyme
MELFLLISLGAVIALDFAIRYPSLVKKVIAHVQGSHYFHRWFLFALYKINGLLRITHISGMISVII